MGNDATYFTWKYLSNVIVVINPSSKCKVILALFYIKHKTILSSIL